MRTLTEFAAPTLKNAARIRQELVAAGKTPEELPAAMGEALKLEGDKLTMILQAVELVGDKVADLKRVVVGALAEGERAPSGAQEKEGKQFVAEYYPPVAGKGGKPSREDRKGGRGERGDRKKGRRHGRGREGGGDHPRGEKREAREGRGGSGGGKPQRAPRPERPAGPIPLPKPRPPVNPPQASEPVATQATSAQATATEVTPASES